MRTFIVFIVVPFVSAALAGKFKIDWDTVRPISEFDHYWERLPAELQSYRNVTPSGRITNGFEAIPGQFPYQVLLLINLAIQNTAVCGGSVLTRNFVLTAAHCISYTGNTLALDGLAIMGAQNIFVQEPSQQRIQFSSSGIRRHPGYLPTSLRNDVALIRLNSPVTFTSRVQPIRLPARTDSRQFGGFTGTVSGHGRTSDASQTLSPVLRFTTNPILANIECIATWGFTLIESQNVCLKTEKGRSSCNGDSGGPLTVDSGGVLQVGIVSFGYSVGCEVGMPSVYARVTYFLSWINAHIY